MQEEENSEEKKTNDLSSADKPYHTPGATHVDDVLGYMYYLAMREGKPQYFEWQGNIYKIEHPGDANASVPPTITSVTPNAPEFTLNRLQAGVAKIPEKTGMTATVPEPQHVIKNSTPLQKPVPKNIIRSPKI